jgi:DNA-binding PadR family transcriptional regulator
MGLLSMGPMSGYDIKKKFEKIAANFWNESYGQIYPILKRLDTEGLATRSVEKQIGKPDRHIYELTVEGHKELVQWLLEPVGRQVGRQEILLKLFFGPTLPVHDNIQQVEHFQKNHEKELQDLKSTKIQMKMDNQDSPHFPYWLMTVRFGELVNEALLKWSREVLSQMEEMRNQNR